MNNLCAVKFTPVTPQCLVDFAPYFRGKNTVLSDISVLYLHMWGAFLGTEYCIEGDTLFLRRVMDDRRFYYPPLRLGSADVVADISLLSRVTAESEISLCALPEHLVAAVEARYTVLDKGTSRRWADYIYRAEDLATLAGKKYHKKRNLVHQFEKLYENATLVPLSPAHIEEAGALVEQMLTAPDISRGEMYECRATLKVLQDFDKLSLVGAALLYGDKLVGFTVGELLDDTLLVHVEKAEREYKGIYQYLNHAFVRYVQGIADFSLVNREDDSGDEGLRQAKLSYYPTEILHKYHLTLKNDFGGSV